MNNATIIGAGLVLFGLGLALLTWLVSRINQPRGPVYWAIDWSGWRIPGTQSGNQSTSWRLLKEILGSDPMTGQSFRTERLKQLGYAVKMVTDRR